MKPVRILVKDYDVYSQHKFRHRHNQQLAEAVIDIDFRAADWRDLELADALRDYLDRITP